MTKTSLFFVLFFKSYLVMAQALPSADMSSDLNDQSVIETSQVVQLPSGEVVHLNLKVVQGRSLAKEEFVKYLRTVSDQREVILASDMSEEEIAQSLRGYSLDNPLINAEKSTAFLEINSQIYAQAEKTRRSEKIEAVIFASLQTAVSSSSFIFLTGLPLESAVVASTLAGFLNFYFNWDISRWDKFQRWGRKQFVKIATAFGHANATQTIWFSKASKSATGFISRLGFNSLFKGITLWTSFATQFFTVNTAQTVLINTGLGFLMTQPFDTTFGDWLENGHSKLSEKQVQLIMRFRSLLSAALVPMLYVGVLPAYVIAGPMITVGFAVTVYDQFTESKYRVQKKINFPKQVLDKVFKNNSSIGLCKKILAKTS